MSTLLDTNVVSELLRPSADSAVLDWLATQPAESFFISVITQAELVSGARALPAGRRRKSLESALEAIFMETLKGRIVPFDSTTVDAYADIFNKRRASGRPTSQFDAQIGATARTRKYRLATRNTKDFSDCGVTLVNPWLYKSRSV